MVRSGASHLLLATALACVLPVAFQAQANAQEIAQDQKHTWIVPQAVSPMPFSTDAPTQRSGLSIEFRPADRMTGADQLLAADAESSIAERAGFADFELGQGKWTYQQIVCRALPDHLFLQYTRNNGSGDVTVFSASIPHGGQGRVRIIPILRRGYSLFSPAPINALTISAFNHIRAEEASIDTPDWLGTGLCYAALAGAHPRGLSPSDDATGQQRIPAITPAMEVSAGGSEVIRFADAAATPRPMEWSMTFTRKGKLMKATHTPALLLSSQSAPKNSAISKTWTVPAAAEPQK